jgi:hypothetical protein
MAGANTKPAAYEEWRVEFQHHNKGQRVGLELRGNKATPDPVSEPTYSSFYFFCGSFAGFLLLNFLTSS